MKRKTVVITVVVASCIIVFGFMALMMLVAVAGDGGFEFSGFSFGPKVAVVELYGQITDSRDFVRQIKRWTEDSEVKAIVLDINSPGGAVAPSQEMYEQVLKARAEGKIVVASFRSVAASGGYYVGCAADRIVSNPGTLTGSIGVILSFPTAKKLFDKIGIGWETIKSGDLKDVGSMSRPMTPEEERMLKAVIDDTYEQFVEAVSEGRDRPKEEIYPLSDGSIFTGRQAFNRWTSFASSSATELPLNSSLTSAGACGSRSKSTCWPKPTSTYRKAWYSGIPLGWSSAGR